MSEPIDLSPDTHVLHSYFNARHDWLEVFGEWTDNAFDAGAKSISFECGKKEMRIVDDGRGCEDLAVMLRMGSHQRSHSTRLGRYGIGGKDAALWVGGEDSTLTVTSVCRGMSRTLHIVWPQILIGGWQRNDGVIERPARSGESGTSIIIQNTLRSPRADVGKKLLDDLGYIYFPALKLGYQIKVKLAAQSKWQPVIRWEPPPFDGAVVNQRIDVDGRGVSIIAGVVRAGVLNPRSGFTYTHGWRVVKKSSAYGCGNHASSRICGFVELDSSWKLTKNKDDISQGADELYLAVEQACAEVLARGDREASELQSSAFEAACSEALNAMVCHKRAKAKREKGDSEGTHQPRNTDIVHTRAKVEQIGDRFDTRRGGGFKVEFSELEGDAIGEFKLPSRVVLNSAHPWVMRYRGRDHAPIVTLAASILTNYHEMNSADGFALLKGFPSSFTDALGKMLAATDLSIDGSPLAEAHRERTA